MKQVDKPATKGDVAEAVEELAQMTQRSFVYMQEHMATKEDLADVKEDVAEVKDDLAEVKEKLVDLEISMATKEDLLHMATKEDLSRLEDRIDAKFDKLIERFDVALTTLSQAIHALIASQEKMDKRLQVVEQKVFGR